MDNLNLLSAINAIVNRHRNLKINQNSYYANLREAYIHRFDEISGFGNHLKISRKLLGINDLPDLDLASIPNIKFTNRISPIIQNKQNDYAAIIQIFESEIDIWVNEKTLGRDAIVINDIHSKKSPNQKPFDTLLGKLHGKDIDAISAAAGGVCQHGLFIYISEDEQIKQPILIQINHVNNEVFFPVSIFLISAARSSGQIIFKISEIKNNKNKSIIPINLSVELFENSQFEMLEIQELGRMTCYFPHEQIYLRKNSTLRKFIFDKGAYFVKRSLIVNLEENGANANISGLYSPIKNQVYVYETRQNHHASNTISDLIFKGVLNENSDTLWMGNVFVQKGTKGVDGYQKNDNLLLNPSSNMESVPGLEILSDEVICSHGVTISNIDKDQLFYMQTRGLNEETAANLIVSGFLQSIIPRLHSNYLIQEVLSAMDNKNVGILI